jgi:nitrogen fixation protein NifB
VTTPGCAAGSGCGSGASAELPDDVKGRIENHPCYSEEAHHHYARMHLAVAPACNIQCNYCNRKYDCANENRPGVVSEKLKPEEALLKVRAVAAAMPQLSVIGIAGPGDPLANPDKTFRTLELVKEALPDLRLCLSTNGLALLEQVPRIAAVGVEHLTVTINMVDPEVGERIYAWVYYKGKRYRGREAARILSERQLEGLEAAARAGILLKVNSVIIPGVNDAHMPEVARKVRSLGAFLHNLLPLLSAPEHGTHYGLTGQRGPTPGELEAVQDSCGMDARLMRHCRQCRADAVGLLGEDRNAEFTLARLKAPAPDATGVRAAYRAAVEKRRSRAAQALAEGRLSVRWAPRDLKARVAVATRGEGLVNEHFGHAKEFQVYDVSRDGLKLIGIRKVEMYCKGGDGEEDALAATLRALADCHGVLVARIGHCPKEELSVAGIEPDERFGHEPIEKAAFGFFKTYAWRVLRGQLAHAERPEPRPELQVA